MSFDHCHTFPFLIILLEARLVPHNGVSTANFASLVELVQLTSLRI